jgi:hypothetical protein
MELHAARSDELVSIQTRLSMVTIGYADQPIWVISKKRICYSSETWNAHTSIQTSKKILVEISDLSPLLLFKGMHLSCGRL